MSSPRALESPSSGAIHFAAARLTPEAHAAARRVLASGWLTTGPEVVAFEDEFARLVDARHAVAVSSCTAGLELSLRAMGLPAGARVLVSSVTFVGALHAIVHSGLTPVLVDVDPETAMPTPETTRAAAEQVGGVDAMMVVHLYGDPAPVDELAEAACLGLDVVVEDAAHALGTDIGERSVGSVSRATSFSFYATKNLPVGEGGMVTTDDDGLADVVRKGRLHGMSRDAWRRYLPGGGWRYDVEIDGLKANMTDLQAAIGRGQLTAFPAWQDRRAELAARYDEQLAGLPGLALPHRPLDGRHAWHIYAVRVLADAAVDRDGLAARLSEQDIGTSVHFIPLHHLSYVSSLTGVRPGQLPGADRLSGELLSLPMHPWLSDRDVDRVCELLNDLLAGPGRTA
jgi:dTDP-4-amino-4,6-dideoxygalactose transaminase